MTNFEQITRDIFDNGAEARLDVEAERTAIAATKTGDEAATVALLYAYAPTLRSVVAAYARRGEGHQFDREELTSAAVLGLLQAVAAFDLDGDQVRLAGTVHDYVVDAVGTAVADVVAVTVPTRTLKRFFAIIRAAKGDEAEAVKMAPSFEMSVDTFLAVRRAVNAASTDVPISGDEGEQRAWSDAARPLWIDGDAFEDATDRILVDLAFASVDDLEEDVCRMRYGFSSYEPMSDAEIGDVVGMPKRTVQRRRTGALDKMRAAIGA